MIIKNGKTISSIYKGSQVIDKIMKGTLVVYESFKNLIASGVPPLTLLNCKGVDLVDYKIFGDSVQDITTTNLADLSKLFVPSSTQHVKYNYDNTKGSLELTSTPTAYDYSYLYLQRDLGIEFELGKTYYYGADITVSGKQTNEQTTILFGITYTGGTLDYTPITENGTYQLRGTFTYTGQETIRLMLNFNYGSIEPAQVKFENIYFSEVDGFEPFDKTPTPDTPIEIESVGERTKNLVDIPDITSKTGNGTVINCNITKPCIISCQEYPKLIANDNGVETSIWRLQVKYLDGTLQSIWDGNLKNSFVTANLRITASEENPAISITYRGTYIREGQYSGIQIEYGNTQTDYEPYGYKIPVKVSGENMFNPNMIGIGQQSGLTATINDKGNIVLNGTLNSGRYSSIPINLDTKKYTFTSKILSGKIENEMYLGFYKYNKSNGYISSTYWFSFATLSSDKQSETTTFEVDEYTAGDLVLGFDFYGPYPTICDNLEISIEVRESTTNNIYLNEPLRKIGDYADYIDFENRKVVRKIYKHSITINDTWYFFNDTTIYNLYRQSVMITDKRSMVSGSRVPGLCNVLISNKGGWNYWYDETVHFGQANSAIYFITKNKYSTVTEIYNYLSNNGENEVYIMYTLATPIEEEIELPNIPTIKGTTILEVDTTIQPSNLEVVYKGKEVK